MTPSTVAAGQTRTTAFDLNVTDTAAALSTDDKTTSVLVIGPTLTLTPPLIAGTGGEQTAKGGTTINPFARVTVSDSNPNPLDSASLTVLGGGTLSGAGVIPVGTGVYTIAATSPSQLTDILSNLSFTPPVLDPGAPTVKTSIELDVADGLQVAHDGGTVIDDVAPPPLPPPPPSPRNFTVLDTTTNARMDDDGGAYTGPVAGLRHQYVNITSDSLNITAVVPDSFIHTGSGNDAIDVSKVNGTNVLDGSTGSNFLVGGTGNDTFFVDDRTATSDIWSTISNFHSGDAATVYGVSTPAFTLDWQDDQGASGFTGLTLHATSQGKPIASMTLVGYSKADLSNGRLGVSFGTDAGAGTTYMYVHGT